MALTLHEVKERLGHGAVSMVAKACGRTVGHTSQVLSGKRPDRVVARHVARRLRVSLADLPAEYLRQTQAA